MNKIATLFFCGLAGLAAFGGIPEDADYICETFFHYRHGIPGESLRAYARERGFSDNDLLERLKYISETRWDSEDPRTHLEAECAVDVTGMLRMRNAVPYLEELLYRDEQRQGAAWVALCDVLAYDNQFLDIIEKAVEKGSMQRFTETCILYGAIRVLSSHPDFLEDSEKRRIYRTLLLYPPDQSNLGLNAEGYDKKLCRHMNGYARSKERLEQVALLAANTNASPELREKYAKELEKMRAIPEDELICLLDLYPPTENELAQTRKDVIDKRADVSTADVEAESSAATADGRNESPRPNGKTGMVTLAVATVVFAVGCAIIFMRRRK